MLLSPARCLTTKQRSVIRKAGKRRGHISGSFHSRNKWYGAALRRRPDGAPRSVPTSHCLSRKFHRVLLKIILQLSVQFRMPRAQSTRSLEECFHRHGKKFGGILCSVRVEQGRYAALVSSAQRCEFGFHHGGPG